MLPSLALGHIYIMRVSEAHVVDHIIVIDRRQWPGLIYEPTDTFPIMMSSITFFKCAGPDADKAKIIRL